MLLVLSDLHLTDGQTSPRSRNVSAEAVGLVLDEAAGAALRHNEKCAAEPWRTPIRELELLLLGDIFDLLRTPRWENIHEDASPWSPELLGGVEGPALAQATKTVLERAGEVLEAIAAYDGAEEPGRGVCRRIREFAARTDAAFPFRGPDGQGGFKPGVSVRFMAGNHDRLINHRAATAMRARVCELLGAEPGAGPAKLFPTEYASAAHETYARHGHEYDRWNFQPLTPGGRSQADYERCSIGDPITYWLGVFLGKRAAQEIATAPGLSDADKATLADGIRMIDDVRPARLAAEWLKAYLERFDLADRLELPVKSAAGKMRALGYYRWWREQDGHDLAQKAFRGAIDAVTLLDWFPGGAVPTLLNFYGKADGSSPCAAGLAAEPALQVPRVADLPVRFALCGHTHRHEVAHLMTLDAREWGRRCVKAGLPVDHKLPADVAAPGGRQVFYVNTGTLRNRISLSPNLGGGSAAAPIENLTYLLVYKRGEKMPDRTALEVWDGTRMSCGPQPGAGPTA